MKELSIEEKAKAYDEALKYAMIYYKNGNEDMKTMMKTCFPVLVEESKDERIRKDIVFYIAAHHKDDGEKARWLAWLEKQGYEPNWCHHNVDLSNCSEEYRKAYYDGWNNCNMQHSQCESEKSYVLKCLINGMKFYYEDNKEATWGTEKFSMKVKDILSWLEKQGNKDMGISNTTRQKLKDNLDNALEKETPESWNEFLEKQSGQKSTDTCDSSTINGKEFPASEKRDFGYFSESGDKIEPKFHEGEWVVSPNGVYWHIDRIENNRYEVSSTNGACADWPLDTDLYHLWTIQDAKDGDVLCCESSWTCIFKTLVNDETFSSYCFMDNTKWFCETGCECHTLNKEFMKAYNGEIKPATKEQRDLLFQKMKEAGYEWDAEKKELKKIEQIQVIDYPDNLPKDNWELIHEFVNKFGRIPKDEDELNVLVKYVLEGQKPAKWSEEDKNMLQSILDEYKSMPIEKRNWLKSLKDRVQLQPI